MALASCPECDGEVSTEASKCPHCGYPLRRDRRTRKLAVVVENFSTVITLVVGTAVFLIGASITISVYVWSRSDRRYPISIEGVLGGFIGTFIVGTVGTVIAGVGIWIIWGEFGRRGWKEGVVGPVNRVKGFYSDRPDWAPWATGAAALVLLWAIALLFG